MEFEHDDFIWSREKTINQCLTKDFTFPKLLLITSGFAGNSLERTFDNYQMIWIEGSLTQSRIRGYDAKECNVSIPKWHMQKYCTHSQSQPEFLFEILRRKKLPCKVYPTSSWADVYVHNDIGRLDDRLSEMLLTKETTATFFYGITLQEMLLESSDMITLPSYMRLTFKVAQGFKDQTKSLSVYLDSIKRKLDRWTRPDPTILQDIVFQMLPGKKNTPIIVSLKSPRKEKDFTKRPLPPVPKPENPVIDAPPIPPRRRESAIIENEFEPVTSPMSRESPAQKDRAESVTSPFKEESTPKSNTYVDLPEAIKRSRENCEKREADILLAMIQAQKLKLNITPLPTPKPCISAPAPALAPAPCKNVERLKSNFEAPSRVVVPFTSRESEYTYEIPTPNTRYKSETVINKTDTKAVCQKEDVFDVRNFSINEVSFYLEVLNLQEYVPIFQKNRVDGIILNELDEDIMIKEFKMKRIEILRLQRFIRTGHIPE